MTGQVPNTSRDAVDQEPKETPAIPTGARGRIAIRIALLQRSRGKVATHGQ